MPIFVTLTFADNVTDTKVAARKFTLGMMRFYEHWKEILPEGLKYVVVPERQKRGALHYHVLVFNLPWIPNIYDEVRDIWGHGHALVKSVKHPSGVTRYLLKYLSKDLKSGRDFNGKRYFVSRGLRQPVVFRDGRTIAIVLKNIPSDCVPYVGQPMQNDWLGKIEYRRYETEMTDVLEAFKDAILPKPTMEDRDDSSPAVAP